MYIKPIFLIVLIGYEWFGTLQGQIIQLKKSVDKTQLDALVSNLKLPAEAEFNFNFNVSDFENAPQKNETEREKEYKRIKKELERTPNNPYLYTKLLQNIPEDFNQLEETRQKAAQLYENHLEKNPGDGNAFYELGNLYLSLFAYEQALEAFNKSREYIPDSSKVWSKVAFFYMSSNRFEEAQQYFQKALELDISNIEAQIFYVFSDAFKAIVRLQQEEEKIEVVSLQTDKSYIQKLMDQFPQNQYYKDLYNATEVLEIFYNFMLTAANKLPEDEDPNLKEIIQSFNTEQERLLRLTKLFQQRLAKHPHNKVMLYNALGVIYTIQAKFSQAIQSFEASIQENTQRLEAYYNLAFVYIVEKQWQKAEKVIQQKIQIEENAKDYTLLTGLKDRQNQLKHALKFCNEGLEKFSKDATLFSFKGMLEYKTGNFVSAKESLRKSLSINPENNIAQYVYGLTLLRENTAEEAYQSLHTSAKLGNQNAELILQEYFDN